MGRSPMENGAVADAVASDRPENRQPWRWLAPAGLLVSVVGLYAWSSWDQGFIYDDQRVIIEQTAPRSLGELARLFAEPHFPGLPYYRPVTRLTLLLQKALHGDRPRAFHLVNAGLMGVAGVLAYALLRLPAFGVRRVLAWLASAIFAFHPVASSCVYPIASGRETLLPAVFVLASVNCFLRAGAGWYAASMVALAAALFCKEQAVVVPVVFVLADLLRLSAEPPGRSAGRWVRRYGPVPVILLLYFVVRTSLFGGSEYALGVLRHPAHVLLSFVYPLQTIVAPFVGLVYEPRAVTWLSLTRLLVAGGVLLLLLVFILRAWASLRTLAWFWLGWFVLTLLPTANLLVQEAHFAERYVFLAALAPLAMAAALASAHRDRSYVAPVAAAVGTCLAVACVLVSAHRGRYFKDSLTFYTQWLRTNPTHPAAHNNLAIALAKSGEVDKALAHFSKAVRLRDDFPAAHYNLANILVQKRDFSAAAEHYERVLELRPDFVSAANKLGVLCAETGQWGRAIAAFRRAHEAVPDDPELAGNLARILATCPVAGLRDGPAAVQLAERACRATGQKNARLLEVLAAAYAEVGRFADAVQTARRALDLCRTLQAPRLTQQIEGRLRLYESGRPYHEPP